MRVIQDMFVNVLVKYLTFSMEGQLCWHHDMCSPVDYFIIKRQFFSV